MRQCVSVRLFVCHECMQCVCESVCKVKVLRVRQGQSPSVRQDGTLFRKIRGA